MIPSPLAPLRSQVTIGPSDQYRQFCGLLPLGPQWASLNRVKLAWLNWPAQKMLLKDRRAECEPNPDQAHQMALCIPMLAGAPALEHLTIEGFVAASSAGLNALTGLRSLCLAGFWHGADDTLGSLTALTRLTALELAFCSGITAAGMAHLAALRGLEVLRIPECGRVKADGFRSLAGLATLQELDISSRATFANFDLAVLGRLTALRRLRLQRAFFEKNPAGVQAPALRALDVTEALQPLHALSCTPASLQELSMGFSEFLKADLPALSFPWLSSLTKLMLTGDCRYEPFQLHARLEALPALGTLVLDSVHDITSKVAANLARLPSLRHLSFVKCTSIATERIARCFASTPITVRIEEPKIQFEDGDDDE